MVFYYFRGGQQILGCSPQQQTELVNKLKRPVRGARVIHTCTYSAFFYNILYFILLPFLPQVTRSFKWDFGNFFCYFLQFFGSVNPWPSEFIHPVLTYHSCWSNSTVHCQSQSTPQQFKLTSLSLHLQLAGLEQHQPRLRANCHSSLCVLRTWGVGSSPPLLNVAREIIGDLHHPGQTKAPCGTFS